ncbi:MAG: CHAD domain-containing protein [Bryobacteraceae bacterium]|jgi:CHAD domain-containing protein
METYPFAVAQATRLLERLAFQINGVVHSPHAGAIHDLRVAIRRFSQVLSACKACFPLRPVRKMRRRLKPIMTLAGEVRDTDVALQLIAAAGAGSLEAKLRARRNTAARSLLASLKDWTARKSVSKWRGALQSGIPPRKLRQSKAEAFAHRELPRLAARFFREGARAAAPQASAGQRHRFRLAAKKFRYTLELFAEFYGPAAAHWTAQVKELQSLLGAMNDCRAARDLVDALGGNPRIEASLKKRQRRKSLEFRRAWTARFGAADAARQWIEWLSHPPRKPVTRSTMSQARGGVALRA